MDTVRIPETTSMGKNRRASTSAGCFLVRKTNIGKFELFVIHEKWPDGKETYVLPKGHREKEETIEETAIRETTEESGYVDYKLVKYIGSRTYELDWDEIWIKTDHYFLAILESDKKVKQDLEEYEKNVIQDTSWLDFGIGVDMLTYENQKEFMDQIKEYLCL